MLMPYSQRSPGSNMSGTRNAARLPLDSGGILRDRVVLQHVAVPDFVAEPGGMRQQVAQRDGALRRAQDRPSGGSKSVEDLRLREGRVDWRAPARRA